MEKLEPYKQSVADLGGARDASQLGQNFFIFMQFLGTITQIIRWRSGILGNSGSATGTGRYFGHPIISTDTNSQYYLVH